MRNQIIYDKWTFNDVSVTGKLCTGSLVRETDPASAALHADTVSVEVKCDDPGIVDFVRNTPMTYFYRGRQKGIYYLQAVERVGPDHYILSGHSAVGRLAAMEHRGGIYTGQTVDEVVREICGTIPVFIKSNFAKEKLYGWLPYAKPPGNSARDNLDQVLFAVGACLKIDLDGSLRIENLWDSASCTIPASQMYKDGRVEYESKVSSVSVIEHQYVAGSEEDTLFEGATAEGDIITFREPMHSLTANGFALLGSGANWAKLSAGSGTLTGKKYVHTTRQITEVVMAGVEENVKSVKEATLVSLVNSRAVARRLAEYYRCPGTVKAYVTAADVLPGDVVQVYHPYDKLMVGACVAKADAVMSATLKIKLEALVGYVPPQIEASTYYDESVILTESGSWTVPEGVDHIRAVLIGGGSGGTPGESGGSSIITSKTVSGKSASFPASSPGKGGAAGTPGAGGKALIIEKDVTAGEVFTVQIGQGGASGTAGGETSFGSDSTGNGASMPNGYFDDVSGTTFGRSGKAGVDGGDGGSPGSKGGDAGEKTGGRGSSSHTEDGGAVVATLSGIGGGGAGTGGVGFSGYAPASSTSWASVPGSRKGTGHFYYPEGNSSPKGGFGLGGNDGVNFGDGGDAGDGGGGAGAFGSVSVQIDVTAPEILYFYCGNGGGARTYGGSGGSGGAGKSGCVILYYRAKEKIYPGPVVDRNGKWFLDKLGRRFIV